jgi:UDP:flavonoid glycosyltransferase YjiC (YdhE family)
VSASVLICPFSRRTWGHLTRCFALADALVALGERVRFACTPEARERVEAAGFEMIDLVVMGDQQHLTPPRSARAAAAARRHFAGELATAQGCLAAAAPDVVVTDLQPIVNVAAALDGLPSASMLNLELMVAPLAWWLPALDRILGELEVPRWAASRLFGDALLVADTPSLVGLRDLPPALAARVTASVREVRFVGPLLGELPPRRPVPPRARPEVIISLGGRESDRLTEILAGCADVDADLVIIVPQAWPELERAADERRRAGRGVTIAEFLPDFARRISEASALITHGGHSTLALALALAVPTLVIPGTVEQEINAKRLHGAGAVASPNASAIRATIGPQLTALLRDRAGDAARARLASSIASYDGARDAALVVHRLARCPPLGGSW